MNFQDYFKGLPDKRVFVTSYDRRTARVYPIAVWRQNEVYFENHRDEASERAYFNAMELGEETEMDNQGRIGLSTDLRKELGLTDTPVKIYARDGAVNIIGEAEFAAKQSDARMLNKESLEELRKGGLK